MPLKLVLGCHIMLLLAWANILQLAGTTCIPLSKQSTVNPCNLMVWQRRVSVSSEATAYAKHHGLFSGRCFPDCTGF
eukprot:2198362-Amphidinium_carterae.1